METFTIDGVFFTVAKIADAPDYSVPTPLVNTHRVSWRYGERTGSFTCITWLRKCHEVAYNLSSSAAKTP